MTENTFTHLLTAPILIGTREYSREELAALHTGDADN